MRPFEIVIPVTLALQNVDASCVFCLFLMLLLLLSDVDDAVIRDRLRRSMYKTCYCSKLILCGRSSISIRLTSTSPGLCLSSVCQSPSFTALLLRSV